MKKIFVLFLAVILCLGLLAGCSAKAADNAVSESPADYGSGAAPMAPQTDAGFAGEKDFYNEESMPSTPSAGSPVSGLKIIYSCSLNIETLKYDDSLAAIMTDLKAVGGWVSSSNQYGGAGARYSYLTLRIPAEKYDEFLLKAGNFGTITNRNDSTQDITGQYVDVEARLVSLKEQETRLLELVSDAVDLESLLKLEERLSQVRYEIESYQSTKNTYDNLIDYCTVDISLYEVSVVSPITAKTFGQQIKDALINSWYAIVAFLRGLVLVLIAVLPFLIFFGILFVIVMIILRKTKPRRMERRARRQAAFPAPSAPPVSGNPYSTAPPADKEKK